MKALKIILASGSFVWLCTGFGYGLGLPGQTAQTQNLVDHSPGTAQDSKALQPQPMPTLAQVDAASQVSAEVDAESEPVEAFEGDLAEGLVEMSRLAKEATIAEAEEFAQRLMVPGRLDAAQDWLEEHSGVLGNKGRMRAIEGLRWLGLASRTAQQKAVVHYDLGILQSQHDSAPGAKASFTAAVYLASGNVREASTYNLGCIELEDAERLYDQIPEVHGRTRSAMSPGFVPGQSSGGSDEEEPDYLVLSRSAFKRAMSHFVDRLRLDWKDADTRANVEWIQRRMEKLREIEEKRKSDEGQGTADDDPGEGEEPPEEEPQQDAGEKGAKSDQEESEEKQPEDSEGPEGESGEENEPQDAEEQEEEKEQSEEESESEEPSEEKPEEKLLTEEEIKRLLKNLEKHEIEGERLRDLVKRRPRGKAKRDW